HGRHRSRAGGAGRRRQRRHRRERDRARGQDPGGDAGRRSSREPVLDQEAADRVAEAGQKDGEPAEELRRATGQVHAQEHPHPGHAEHHAGQPRSLRPLLVVDPDREDRGEDRRRGDQDAREARGDLLLARGDQDEGARHLDDAHEGQRSGPGPQAPELTAGPGDGQEHPGAHGDARPGDHPRGEVADADLDEQVARAPEAATRSDDPSPTRVGVAGSATARGRRLPQRGRSTVPVLIPPYENVGTTGHCRFQSASSDDGKTFRKRGSRGLGSASAFSLIIESYWSIESSSVFEFRITSRPKYSAARRTPGILDRWGCQLSAATPFSDETQTPSSVLMQSEWLPSVWPGVQTSATPLPSSTSPSTSTTFSVRRSLIPSSTYQAHCIGCSETKVSHSLRWAISLALGKSGSRGAGSPSMGSVVPRMKRRSCTCRWSKLTKSTSSGRSPRVARASAGSCQSLEITL